MPKTEHPFAKARCQAARLFCASLLVLLFACDNLDSGTAVGQPLSYDISVEAICTLRALAVNLPTT